MMYCSTTSLNMLIKKWMVILFNQDEKKKNAGWFYALKNKPYVLLVSIMCLEIYLALSNDSSYLLEGDILF